MPWCIFIIFSVENVEGKVEQEASDKDIRPRNNKLKTMRIIMVPLSDISHLHA
jgi:hypothetical protein